MVWTQGEESIENDGYWRKRLTVWAIERNMVWGIIPTGH